MRILKTILFLLISSVVMAHDVPFYRHSKYTEIILNNPTSFSVKLLVKCDWNGKKWLNEEKYKLNRKSRTSIKVSNGSRCLIIPKLL